MKLFLCLALSASAALAAEGYHVIQKIHIGGSGAFDRMALDESARRLYISNDNRVVVVDVDANKVAGEIPGEGVQGVAIAPDLGRGFISDGKSDKVTIFDLKTLKPIGQYDGGSNPGPIVYEPKTGHVFAFSLTPEDGTATVLDAKTGDAAGKVMLGGKATAAVADGNGQIWINLQITDEDWNVSSHFGVIDAAKLTLLRHTSISPCDRPTDLAADAKSHRAFPVCGNSKMALVDAESGKVLDTVATGKLAAGAGFDAGAALAFSANGGDGTLTVASETGDKFGAPEQAPTARGSRILAVDPKTHNVYLPAVDYAGAATTPTADSFMLLVVGK